MKKLALLLLCMGSVLYASAQSTPSKSPTSKTAREEDENIRIQSSAREPFSVSGGKVTGYMYRVRIMILTDKHITIDSVWVEDMLLTTDLERYTMKDSHKKTDLRKNETVAVSGTIKDQVKKIYEKCPHKYDGKLLIAYTVGNEKKYFAIKNIKDQNGGRDNFKK